MAQLQLFRQSLAEKDVVYTDDIVAQAIIEFYKPSGVILDPCKGDGAFYRHLPAGSHWCEITEGKDFFAWNTKVDWVIGNPPYSIFANWLYHSMEIADNICYLVPPQKFFYSYKTKKVIDTWGGLKHEFVIGPAAWIGFPFGWVVSAVLLQRGYKGGMVSTIWNAAEQMLAPDRLRRGRAAAIPLQSSESAEVSPATIGGR